MDHQMWEHGGKAKTKRRVGYACLTDSFEARPGIAGLAPDRRTRGEMIRFLLVGIKSNLLYCVLFVGLTFLGVDQRIALTAIYAFAIVYMFLFNKYYVFKNRDKVTPSQIGRHLALYGAMWVTNIVFFQVLAVHLHVNGYIVQLLFVAIMVIVIFVSSKYYVFRGQIASVDDPTKQ